MLATWRPVNCNDRRFVTPATAQLREKILCGERLFDDRVHLAGDGRLATVTARKRLELRLTAVAVDATPPSAAIQGTR